MKRVCCVYFSPTGGTMQIAHKLAQAMAAELNIPLECFDITLPAAREQIYNFGSDELVVIASPTYAGRIPNKMLPEFERLVHGAGSTPAVAVSVYGGRSNDEGLRELILLAEKNGFNVIAAAGCVTRHSMSKVLAAHRPGAQDLEDLADFGRKAARKAIADPAAVEIDRDTPIAPYYKPFKEDMTPAVFLKAKPLTHADKCIACGSCAASCPMGSISFDDFSTVSGVCIKCHACVRKCSVGAKYFDNEELLSHIRVLEKLFKGEQDNLYLI